MQLRKLQEKDAPYMLEWMQDVRVNLFFRFDPNTVTLDSVLSFIRASLEDINNYHLAIVDDEDVYQGTISLKNIDNEAKTAEYAISIRHSSQGKGLGAFATQEILKIGFKQLGLNKIYLNVLSDNSKAIKLYQRCGFVLEGEFRQHIKIREELKDLKWFGILRGDYDAAKQ